MSKRSLSNCKRIKNLPVIKPKILEKGNQNEDDVLIMLGDMPSTHSKINLL